MIHYVDIKCPHLAIPFIRKIKSLSSKNIYKLLHKKIMTIKNDRLNFSSITESDHIFFLSLLSSFSVNVLITRVSFHQSRHEGSTMNKQKGIWMSGHTLPQAFSMQYSLLEGSFDATVLSPKTSLITECYMLPCWSGRNISLTTISL